MRNKRQKIQVPVFLRDPIEDDPIMQIYLEMAEEEAHTELAASGHSRGFGYGPVLDMAKKRILKQKYQIEWKTLEEMNPGWTFD